MNGFINEKNPTFNTIISNQTNSRVALISFGGTAYNHSIRSIAAYLRAQKYNVSIIQCLPEGKDNIFSLLNKGQLEHLGKHCEGMLTVGISVLTTHYLNRAIQINNYIKEKLNIPVIWGRGPGNL
jgi:hypothetical protein